MRYLRSFRNLPSKPGIFDAQFLVYWEDCGFLRVVVPVGQQSPGLHKHAVDQFYYILEGEMTVQIGNQTYQATKDTLVFLPAGVPHRNWNSGSVDEVHLEILAPMPSPLTPLSIPVESSDSPPPPNCIRHIDPSNWEHPEGGHLPLQWLARRSNGSEHIMINVASIEPGGSGPKLHIHEFYQCYFVLSGEMMAEVAGERYTLKPYDLVVIPPGVPHYQWNAGSEPGTRITINTPEPEGEVSQWILPVDFARR